LVTRVKRNGGSQWFAGAACLALATAAGCGGDGGQDLFEDPAEARAGTAGKGVSGAAGTGRAGSEAGGRGATSAGGSSQGAAAGRSAGGAAGDDSDDAGDAGAGAQSGGSAPVAGSPGHGGEAAAGGDDDPTSGGTGGTHAGSGGQVNPSGGNGASGGDPDGSGGSSGAEGGAGGALECGDCDDANPCTDDVCGKAGCEHVPNDASCDDGNACTVEDRCSEGACKAGTERSCDDGSVCTLDRCDPELGCGYEAASGTATDDVDQHIKDGKGSCGESPGDDVLSKVTLSAPGNVASVAVTVDLEHPWVGDLVIELTHGDTTVRIVNMPPNGMATNAGKLDGVYTFKATGTALPFRMTSSLIMPGTYRSFETLAAFAGSPVAGEWTLRIADYCMGDDGDFSAFTLAVTAACEGELACSGVCNAGACECN
jgi:subtilisin-like proprotein convertase family protein